MCGANLISDNNIPLLTTVCAIVLNLYHQAARSSSLQTDQYSPELQHTSAKKGKYGIIKCTHLSYTFKLAHLQYFVSGVAHSTNLISLCLRNNN